MGQSIPKYSRIDQVKFVEDDLPQILLGLFFNVLSPLSSFKLIYSLPKSPKIAISLPYFTISKLSRQYYRTCIIKFDSVTYCLY